MSDLVLIEDRAGDRPRRRWFSRRNVAFLEERGLSPHAKCTVIYFATASANDLGAIHLASTTVNLPLDEVVRKLNAAA